MSPTSTSQHRDVRYVTDAERLRAVAERIDIFGHKGDARMLRQVAARLEDDE